jgi:hypothetical protein
MRQNPRHVKRLINVYRLVRTIAEWKSRVPGEGADAQVILNGPAATVRWIVAASQWPYTTGMMLYASRRLEQSDEAGVLGGADVLHSLYQHVKPDLLPATQERFDDEVAAFEALLKTSRMAWAQLRVIRDYTVNFNPAVTEQLRIEALRRQGQASPSRAHEDGSSDAAED